MTEHDAYNPPADLPGTAEAPSAPSPTRSPGRTAAVVGGLAVLVAAVAFGAFTLLGTQQASPEEAARRLFAAIEDADLIGVMEALPPSEREVVRQPLTDMAEELERLDIVSGDFDMRNILGVDVRFEDLGFETEDLDDDLSMVTVASGRMEYRVDPEEFPLGGFLEDVLGDPADEEAETGSTDFAEGEPMRLVALQEGRSWYISVGYTIAEAARSDAGAERPDYGNGVEPQGAETPEEAVEQMVEAALALDVERVIALLPPGEGRALQDHAPLFLEDARQAAAEAGFRAELESIELEAEGDGDRARVALREFDVTFETEGEAGSLAYDGECFYIETTTESDAVCSDDEGTLPGGLDGLNEALREQGFTAVRDGGEWYVSPIGTLLDSVVAFLRAVEEEDLEDFRRLFRGLRLFGEFQEGVREPEDEVETRGVERFLDLDGDGLIGRHPPEEFARLSPEAQQRAIEEELSGAG